MNTARAWTIAWGIMNGITLPAKLPAAFVESISAMGYPNRMLFDAMHWAEEDDRNLALDAVEKSIATIRKEVFPLLIGSNRY
jgi:acetoin utilization protein AcuC